MRSNQLTNIDLSSSKVKSLDIANCTGLATISGWDSLPLRILKASNTALTQIRSNNYLQILNVNNCANLTSINLSSNNELEIYEARNCRKLTSIEVHSTRLMKFDLTGCDKVTSLDIRGCTKLTSIIGFSDLPLQSLKANDAGITTITGKASLQTLSANSCSNLTTIDASACNQLTTLEAKNGGRLATVEVHSTQLTKLDLSGSATKTLNISNCPKLTKVEGSLTNLTSLKCSGNVAFTTDFLKGVLEGTNASHLETCEARNVNLPAQINVSKSLKKLDLYNAKGLSSLTVSTGSALQSLDLSGISDLKELDVLQAKDLKKLDFSRTGVKKTTLAGLDKLEEVYVAANYPARLLMELICQLHDRKNLEKGRFKYQFTSSELHHVNGREARDKNWMVYNTDGGTDVTDQCNSNVTCNGVVPPTNADEVHLELTGNTRLSFSSAKNTMVWLSTTSNKNDYYYNDYYVSGNSAIELKGKEHVYLFTQPGALKGLKIEEAGTVKNIDLTSLPALEKLTLKKATLLQSLDITKQTELTALELQGAKDLASIDLAKNTKLEKVFINDTKLSNLDLSKHKVLKQVNVERNQLTSLKISASVTSIWAYSNQLSNVDVSMAPGIYVLRLENNKLATLTLATDKSKYSEIRLGSNSLVTLDLQGATALKILEVDNNVNLSTLNLRGCANLKELNMSNCTAFNELKKSGETKWFLDGCQALTEFKLYGTGLNAANLTKLYCLLHQVASGKLYVVDKANATSLQEAENSGTSIAKEKGWNVLDSDGSEFTGRTMNCNDIVPNNVPVIELVISGNLTVKLKTSAKELWIENGEGNYEYKEVNPGQEIELPYNALLLQARKFHGKITSFDISNQTAVQKLVINGHDHITELNAANCTALTQGNLTLTKMKSLAKLIINGSNVKELDLAQFPALKELNCANNQLKELSFLHNPLLEKVDCSNNAVLKKIVALKKVGTGAAPLKELKCWGSALNIEAFNDLFCTLPERIESDKGKLYAVTNSAEANQKLVPNTCYTSRAKDKYWEILLADGTEASTGGEESGNHACEPKKVTSITIDPVTLEHHAVLTLNPTIEPEIADDKTVEWIIKDGTDKLKLYDGGIIEALELGTATLECAAKDGSGVKTEVTVTIVEKKVEKIKISTSKNSPFQLGDQVQFTAKIEPEDATYREVTWSVDGSAATIDPQTGLLLAKATTTELRVIAKTNSPDYSQTAECRVAIEAPTVNGLLLTQDPILIKKDGKKYPLGVTLDPPTAALTGDLQVTVSQPVATVTYKKETDNDGFIRQPIKLEVQGIQEGKETTVTIAPTAFPAISKTFTVKVVKASEFTEPTEMNLQKTLDATVGTPVTLTAEVLPDNATNRAVYWSLKDEQSAQVVRIDLQGKITPLKQGTATVVATAVGKPELTQECQVNVTNVVDQVPASAKLIATLTVVADAQLQLQMAGTGNVYLQNTATNKAYQYSLSDAYYAVPIKCEAATLKIYGALTKLEAKDAGSNITAIEFTKDAKLTELNVSGNALTTLELDALTTLKKLNCTKNQLTQLNLVPLTELVELQCGQNLISELDLTKNVNLQKISCEELKLTTLNLNEKTNLKEVVCYGNSFSTETYNEIYCALPTTTNGVIIPAKEKVTSSADANYLAMLASSGALATQKGWKVVYLDNTAIETTGTKTSCQKKIATGITASPLTVTVDGTLKIQYTFQPEGATAALTFTSRNPEIATVDADGNVKGVKEGNVIIDITTDVTGVKGECPVTVKAKPAITATGIKVSPLTVEVEKTAKIQYSFEPEGATASLTFTSRDIEVATVDAAGNVTGVKEGIVIIDVTTDVPDVKGECTVTVNAKGTMVTGIKVSPLTVEVEKTAKIQYSFEPEGTTAALTFTSRDTDVATVDAGGNVTGVKEGTVIIDVTTDIPDVKGECTVTVTKGTDVQDLFFANVHIMPNPFNTQLRIVLNGELQGMQYELINLAGSTVRKGQINSSETQIETSELQSGIYLLRLSTETGLVKSYRLVKE